MDAGKIVGGGAAGVGIGPAAVYLANRLGAHLNAEDGSLIGVVAVALGAFIVHNGIRGVWGLIWHGSGNAPAPADPAAPAPPAA